MKNALVLHGTNDSSEGNWFPWLQVELERIGWKVWVPDLPQADAPNMQRYQNFIFSSDWKFDNESVIVGHSSGAVAILGLLQALPEGTVIDTAVFVGAFKNDLGWDSLKELFSKPFDFAKIRASAKRFVFLHSDNDPFCPLEGATSLSKELGGELIVVPGASHFSLGTGGDAYEKLPIILDILHEPH